MTSHSPEKDVKVTDESVKETSVTVDTISSFVNDEHITEIMRLQQNVLHRFAQMKKQLDSLDKDTIRQVDSACKEISRNCELLSVVRQDLDTIYRTTRAMKRRLAAKLQQERSAQSP